VFGGNSVEWVLSNTSDDVGYVTKLTPRGIAIRTYESAVAESEDAASISAYSKRPLDVVLAYQDSQLVAQDFANYLLSRWKDPKTLPTSVTIVGNRSDTMMTYALKSEPGDLLTLTESQTGISQDYFIQGVHLEVLNGEIVRTSWTLVEAIEGQFWLLGVTGSSELGLTTVLGV